MEMRSVAFRKKGEGTWRKLEHLLTKAEKQGLAALTPQELNDLVQTYRLTCSSLYVARTISLDVSLHQYLEHLVTRGYLIIYCSKPSHEGAVRHFFFRQFPALVRKNWPYLATAFAILLLGILTGWIFVAQLPEHYYSILDPEIAQGRTPTTPRNQLEASLRSGRGQPPEALTYFASRLFTHNTKVGFLCFALGILFGIPTLYLLFYNGATLGAMSWVFHTKGLAVPWWAWILPHGITEFLAILLCATAGLMIGVALIRGGEYGRLYEIRQTGREAGLIVMGSVVLFFLAGVIEGYFRQLDLPDGPRYMLALATLLWWIYYFGFVGGKPR